MGLNKGKIVEEKKAIIPRTTAITPIPVAVKTTVASLSATSWLRVV
jgi:hypothetical protein